jgi:hypothetical protein
MIIKMKRILLLMPKTNTYISGVAHLTEGLEVTLLLTVKLEKFLINLVAI